MVTATTLSVAAGSELNVFARSAMSFSRLGGLLKKATVLAKRTKSHGCLPPAERDGGGVAVGPSGQSSSTEPARDGLAGCVQLGRCPRSATQRRISRLHTSSARRSRQSVPLASGPPRGCRVSRAGRAPPCGWGHSRHSVRVMRRRGRLHAVRSGSGTLRRTPDGSHDALRTAVPSSQSRHTDTQAAPLMELSECIGCTLPKIRQNDKHKLRSVAISLDGKELQIATAVCATCAKAAGRLGLAVVRRHAVLLPADAGRSAPRDLRGRGAAAIRTS